MAQPLREVLDRRPTHPEHTTFYQDERLSCGHINPSAKPRWRKNRSGWGGEWVWPKRRRCAWCRPEPKN